MIVIVTIRSSEEKHYMDYFNGNTWEISITEKDYEKYYQEAITLLNGSEENV